MSDPAKGIEAITNLLVDLPLSLPEEAVSILLRTEHVRIERIVSTGQASPPGFWYDQAEGEWVVLLHGAARLSIAGEAAPRSLTAGDILHLPPRLRHRVEWTDPTEPTVWLAIFYS
jgi:cupin 2 domain-containing protein